jgi:hypothetical protein
LDPINLRLAYHLALGLFHLRDWTFWQYSGDPSFPFSSRGGDYQKFLERQSSDFGYMRDLANAVKHADLDPKKKPSTQMVGLAKYGSFKCRLPAGRFSGRCVSNPYHDYFCERSKSVGRV